MCTKNSCIRLIVPLMLGLAALVAAQSRLNTIESGRKGGFRFTSTKGLTLQVLPQPGARLCAAEIVILTPFKGTYPGISQIAYENLFNPLLAEGHNSLLAALRRLGGDFFIINGGDHVRIRVTFLPRRINAFIQFVEKLFSFQDFSQGRFNSSIRYYGSRMRRSQDWETRVVYQLAYRHLFPDHPLGTSLVTRETLNRARLAHVVTFVRRNFRLAHANLIIKGDVKPYITFGLVEKAFNNYRRSEPALPSKPPDHIPQREVILFHTGRNSPVQLFWFKVIPPVNNPAHLAALVTEKILFGTPLGKVFRSASLTGLGAIRIETDIQDHRDLSVICNRVTRLAPEDIGRFVQLARSERRKLALQSVDRKDYLYAVNYLYSRYKVNSASFSNDLQLKSLEQLCGADPQHIKVDQANFQNIFQQVSLNQVNHLLQSRKGNHGDGGPILGEVIVITGDADRLAPYLGMFSFTRFQPGW